MRHLEAASELDVPPSIWADFVSAAERITELVFPQGLVGLRVVGDAAIAGLNRGYRGVDQTTDILSFPAGPGSPTSYHGDLALSWDAIERQARANGHSELTEALALTAHGLLHLAGLDHDTDAAAAAMERRTRELLGALAIEVSVFGH